MRILLINFRDITNPRAGGAEVHLHEIFTRIAGMGHDVHLLCSGYQGASRYDTIDGMTIIRTGREAYFNFAVMNFLLMMKPRSYDVILEDVNKIPVYSPLFTRIPVILIVPHLFGTTVFQEAGIPIGLYVCLWELLMPFVYRGLEIEVISDSTKKDLVNRGFREEKIHIIYCGIDTRVYHPDDSDRHEAPYPYIVFVGRLKKYKRVDLLLEAFRILCGEDGNVRLLVIGEGDYASKLAALACRLGIGDRVIFTGYAGEREKVRYMRGARFVVNTSPKEGWGLTNIEAQACGVPVIASESPGLIESVRDGETGLIVPHGDTGALAQAMAALLHDAAYREKLSRTAIEWASRFNWDRSAEETIELIHRIRPQASDPPGRREKQ
jgi:glycosyltransferase involved in cell wall biosynthesis